VTRNTLYEGYEGIRLPREVQIKRVNRVIAEELTPIQREILLEYYIQNRKITDIARDRGVHKSTVSRTLKRAEGKLRRYLRY
jgi:RNA polymerase sigma factor (sigma-70 family)